MDDQAEKFKAVFTCFVTMLESTHRRIDELANRTFSIEAAISGLDKTFDEVRAARAEEINLAVEHLTLLMRETQNTPSYARLFDSL